MAGKAESTLKYLVQKTKCVEKLQTGKHSCERSPNFIWSVSTHNPTKNSKLKWFKIRKRHDPCWTIPILCHERSLWFVWLILSCREVILNVVQSQLSKASSLPAPLDHLNLTSNTFLHPVTFGRQHRRPPAASEFGIFFVLDLRKTYFLWVIYSW